MVIRYGLNRVPVNDRLCETCNLVEDEIHVLLHCSMFDDIRHTLFTDGCNIKSDFRDLPVDSQFISIMSDPRCFKFIAKAMYCIFKQTTVCDALIIYLFIYLFIYLYS